MEWRGGKGRAGHGRVPDCLGGLSRVGISSRSTRPWNGQPPSNYKGWSVESLHTAASWPHLKQYNLCTKSGNIHAY